MEEDLRYLSKLVIEQLQILQVKVKGDILHMSEEYCHMQILCPISVVVTLQAQGGILKEAYGNMVSSNNITDAISYIFPDMRFGIKTYFRLRTVHLHYKHTS